MTGPHGVIRDLEDALLAAHLELQFYDNLLAQLAAMAGVLGGVDPLTRPDVVLDTLNHICDSEFVAVLEREAADRFRVVTFRPDQPNFGPGACIVSPCLRDICRNQASGRTHADYIESVSDADDGLAQAGVHRLSAVAYRLNNQYRVLAMCNRRSPVADPGGPGEQYYRTPEGTVLRVVVSLFPL